VKARHIDVSAVKVYINTTRIPHLKKKTTHYDFRREYSALPNATDAGPVPAKGSGCEKDAEEYNMCHPRRGIALIFNHDHFDWMAFRSGSSKDCKDLSLQLEVLGFEIEVHKDLTYSQLSKVLRESK
jgi:caspase-like apoptosis-related cysteine protease